MILCGNNDAIESGVSGFIAKNLEDYIEIIENLVQNKYNIKQIQENARKSIEEKYNTKRMINEYLKLYTSEPRIPEKAIVS